MTDEKKPVENLRELIASTTTLEHGFWMNASMAGKLFDLCHGTKELPDDEGNMLPCVGCRGCKPELAAKGIDIDDYAYEPEPVSGVRNK